MTEFVLNSGNAMGSRDGWTGEMNDHTHVDDPAVAAVLAAAAAPAEGPVPGEAEALTAFRSVHQPHRRIRMPRYSEKAKLIAAAVFGGVVVLSGAATAATGSIPLVHGHSHQPSTHTPDGTDDDQGTDVTDSTDTETPDADTGANDPNSDHGTLVSTTAHNAPQGHKGATVCAVASDGKCKAGQDHGQSTADSHGNADANTNATNHRQNGLTTHGKADANTNATNHRQNGLTTHGQAGQHGNTSTP